MCVISAVDGDNDTSERAAIDFEVSLLEAQESAGILYNNASRNLLCARLEKVGSDRALGVLFGAVRGGVIVLALVALGGMLSLSRETWWSGAYLSAPLETAVLACKPWLPQEVAKRIRFR